MIRVTQSDAAVLGDRAYPALKASWVVERRYSEFAALDKKCKEYVPGLKVKLPGKRVRKLELVQIEQRRKSLAVYLSALLSEKVALGDASLRAVIYAFLQPADGGKFQKLARTRVLKRLGNNSVKQKSDAARDRDLKSFTDGFLVTADELEEELHTIADAASDKRSAEPSAETRPWWVPSDVSDAAVLAASAAGANDAGVAGPSDASGGGNGAAAGAADGVALFDRVLQLLEIFVSRIQRTWMFQALFAVVRVLFKATVEECWFTFVDSNVTWLETDAVVFNYLSILRDTMFPPPPQGEGVAGAARPAADAKAKVGKLRTFLVNKLPAPVAAVGGTAIAHDVIDVCIDSFQCPIYNKQIALVLLDSLLGELFADENT